MGVRALDLAFCSGAHAQFTQLIAQIECQRFIARLCFSALPRKNPTGPAKTTDTTFEFAACFCGSSRSREPIEFLVILKDSRRCVENSRTAPESAHLTHRYLR